MAKWVGTRKMPTMPRSTRYVVKMKDRQKVMPYQRKPHHTDGMTSQILIATENGGFSYMDYDVLVQSMGPLPAPAAPRPAHPQPTIIDLR